MDIGLTAKVSPEIDERQSEREAGKLQEMMDNSVKNLEAAVDMAGVSDKLDETQELAEGVTEASMEAADSTSRLADNVNRAAMSAEQMQMAAEQSSFAGSMGLQGQAGEMAAAQNVMAAPGPFPGATMGQTASTGPDQGQSRAGGEMRQSLVQTAANTRSITGMLSQMGNLFLNKGGKVALAGLGLIFLSRLVGAATNASPLLASVADIFGMAMKLFFRPFGNAIGAYLKPMAIALLDLAAGFNRVFQNRGLLSALGWLAGRLLEIFTSSLEEFARLIIAAFAFSSLIGKIEQTLVGLFKRLGLSDDMAKYIAKLLTPGKILDTILRKIGGLFSRLGSGIAKLGSKILGKIGLKGIGTALVGILKKGFMNLFKKLGLKALVARFAARLGGSLVPGLNAVLWGDLIFELIFGFSPIFDVLIPAIIDGLWWLVDGTMAVVDWILGIPAEIGNFLSGIGDMINLNIPGLGIVESAIRLIVDPMQFITDILYYAFGNGVVIDLLDTLITLFVMPFQAMFGLIDSFTTWIFNLWTIVNETVAPVLGGIKDAVDMIPTSFGDVQELFSGGTSFTKDVLGGTVSFVDDVLGGSVSFVSGILGGSVSFVDGILGGSVAFVSGILGGPVSFSKDILSSSVSFTKDVLGGTVSFVGDILGGTVSFVTGILGGSVPFVSGILGGTVSFVSGILGGTVSFVSELLGGTVSFVGDILSGGANMAQKFWDWLTSGTVDIAGWFEEKIPTPGDVAEAVPDLGDIKEGVAEVVPFVDVEKYRSDSGGKNGGGGGGGNQASTSSSSSSGKSSEMGLGTQLLTVGGSTAGGFVLGGPFGAASGFGSSLVGSNLVDPEKTMGLSAIHDFGQWTGGKLGLNNSGGGGGGDDDDSWIPSFAEGGIVTGPTQAIIGEGSESEAVLPLSKLESFVEMPEQPTPSADLDVSSSIDPDEASGSAEFEERDGEVSSKLDDVISELRDLSRELSKMDSGEVKVTADGKVLAEVTENGVDKYKRTKEVNK